jgi:hypothetical protein
MAATKNRRTTPKGIMERVTGKKLESNVLPASHKVLIMEYLLSCPTKEVQKYSDIEYPTFINECATLLYNDRLYEFMKVLSICRDMAEEDKPKGGSQSVGFRQ